MFFVQGYFLGPNWVQVAPKAGAKLGPKAQFVLCNDIFWAQAESRDTVFFVQGYLLGPRLGVETQRFMKEYFLGPARELKSAINEIWAKKNRATDRPKSGETFD